MKTTDVQQQGRMSGHFQGVGTADRAAVEERAREIAVINGRDASAFTQADWDEAKQELTGTRGEPRNESGAGVAAPSAWNPAPGTGAARAPLRRPSDEQTVAEQLVQEGVDEAAHEQMLEGSRRSRKEDQI